MSYYRRYIYVKWHNLYRYSHARGRGFEPRQPHQWKTVTKVTVFSFFEDGEPRPAFIRDAGFCAGGA